MMSLKGMCSSCSRKYSHAVTINSKLLNQFTDTNIVRNAMMYNASDSQVYEMAKEMMKDCEGHFAHFRNMELELDKEG